MKRRIKVNVGKEVQEREISYIPFRYVLAVIIALFEILTIIGIVVWLCYYVPYFYILALITALGVELKIISCDDNPEYKVPWMICVLCLPIVGFMLYFLFYSRKLKKKYIKKLEELNEMSYEKDDSGVFEMLDKKDVYACNQTKMLCNISGTHAFINTSQKYLPSGEEYFISMLSDLERAEKFIYMEYFIIEEGKFWNSILDVLKKKVKEGVEVKVIFDDIGCMNTLPGNYARVLKKKFGIDGTQFSRLRGSADSEFNNRNHRKITVIDGKIGYTGGINIADEYINEKLRFGHWKDAGIRLEGEGVWELTRLFLIDFGINVKEFQTNVELYPQCKNVQGDGIVVPFGDGPKPLYDRYVGKSVIQNMLNSAKRYVYITTPYLIIDNDLCTSIENASLRGVDVRIVLPHIPDKKLIFLMSRSYYSRLMNVGVKIYEYEKGFVHAKTYIADDEYAMVGTINLDYRSLVHHFEDGVWMYGCSCIEDIKKDVLDTIESSIKMTSDMIKTRGLTKLFRALVRLFAPML